jgi:hypothetical protein
MKHILSENQFDHMRNKFNREENQSLEEWLDNINSTTTLTITTSYPNYPTFYKSEKKQIYLGYIETFKKLAISKDKDKQFIVMYLIEEMRFTTNLVVDRNKVGVLKSHILPFFEQLEEYEICEEIIELYNSLN